MPQPQDISATSGTWSLPKFRGQLRKYLSAGILTVVAGLACLGIWFTSRLDHTLQTEVGHRAAVLLERTLAPYAPALAAGTLSPEVTEVLNAHFQQVSLSMGVFDMLIWTPGGRVIYGARRDMTGRTFPVGPDLAKALSGRISVTIEDEFHANATASRLNGQGKFFGIYVPVRLSPGNRIVAVAEYYQDAAAASRALLNVRWQMWGAICTIGIFLVAALYHLMRRGDAALQRQSAEFGSQLSGLAARMEQDHQAAVQIRLDAQRLQEQQENRLRQINADIHDGIGQLLTVALLRMQPSRDDPGDTQAVQTILEEAMGEVQALLTGTSPGQPHDLPLAQAVRAVVDDHVRRTGTDVDLRLDGDLPEPSLEIRVALCRFLREGLHNAFKHAGGTNQRVALRAADGRLDVSVSDGGGGLVAVAAPDLRRPMGLDNLRHRIERLGGTLVLVRHDTPGMRLHATFPLVPAESTDVRHHRSDRR